jgi:hypothetical protein
MIDISTVTDKTVENIKPHLTNIITHATQAVVDSESHLVSTLGQHVSTALSGVFGTTTLEQTEPLVLDCFICNSRYINHIIRLFRIMSILTTFRLFVS